MASQDHVFICIGLENGKPESIAAARTDRKGQPLTSFSGRISTQDTFEDLMFGMKREILSGLSREYVVIAHHPEIERTILRKHYPSSDVAEIFDGRLWISTSQLVWPMVDANMLPSTNFSSVCSYMGFPLEDLASPEETCTALCRVFFEVMRRYRTALVVEEGVRDFAGPTLDKVRKMMGI